MSPILEDLTPPVDPDRDHWRGGEQAAVTLVEYGDYECPYSRMAFRVIQRLERQLGGARGTPTLFVNGRLHAAGYDEPTLGAALATAIKER